MRFTQKNQCQTTLHFPPPYWKRGAARPKRADTYTSLCNLSHQKPSTAGLVYHTADRAFPFLLAAQSAQLVGRHPPRREQIERADQGHRHRC